MTNNELKFFDPRTGEEWHRVPDGATIPLGEYWRYAPDSECHRGMSFCDLTARGDLAYFTREPIAPPAPPLPTEPGFYADKDGDLWKLVDGGRWELVDGCIYSRESVASYAPFVPVTFVPTETWDRLRVLDPEDTRDRIGAGDTQWRWAEGAWRHVCDNDCRTACSSLEGLSDWYGPLRFADEVSDR